MKRLKIENLKLKGKEKSPWSTTRFLQAHEGLEGRKLKVEEEKKSSEGSIEVSSERATDQA